MNRGLKCDNCGKGIMYGHNVSHAKNRTRKIFKPNLHRAKILVGGVHRYMRLCTKCLRKLKTSTSAKASTDAKALADRSADKQNLKIEEPQIQPQVVV